MNEKEAIDGLRRIYIDINDCSKYPSFGVAYKALEKRIPIKVTEVHVDEYYCPACGAENNCNDGVVEDKFCPECGQALGSLI